MHRFSRFFFTAPTTGECQTAEDLSTRQHHMQPEASRQRSTGRGAREYLLPHLFSAAKDRSPRQQSCIARQTVGPRASVTLTNEDRYWREAALDNTDVVWRDSWWYVVASVSTVWPTIPGTLTTNLRETEIIISFVSLCRELDYRGDECCRTQLTH